MKLIQKSNRMKNDKNRTTVGGRRRPNANASIWNVATIIVTNWTHVMIC